MDFTAAEREFRRLEALRQGGYLTDDAYRARVNALQVPDAQGRTWMLQERTGRWHVWHEGAWQPAAPPVSSTPSRSSAAAAPETQSAGGCKKVAQYVLIWAVCFTILGAVLYLAVGRDTPEVLLGVGLAALLSLVLMLTSLASGWEGVVEDIRVETERRHGEDTYHDERVTYAYVRLNNGRRKKMRAMPGWQPGDRLRKQRGEMYVRKVDA